jgi:predicted RNA-binding protein with PIN domain
MSKRMVFVDGYNLIRNDPTLSAIEARSLEAGRRALISRLLTSYDQRANQITIVFDGANAPEMAPSAERYGDIHVLYSRGETADALITRLVNATPPGQQTIVLSDDGQVRSDARSRGAVVGGSADRAKARPTRADLSGKDKDSGDNRPRTTQKKGNPRRAKRRTRRQPDVGVRW